MATPSSLSEAESLVSAARFPSPCEARYHSPEILAIWCSSPTSPSRYALAKQGTVFTAKSCVSRVGDRDLESWTLSSKIQPGPRTIDACGELGQWAGRESPESIDWMRGWPTWDVGNNARNEMRTPKDKPIAAFESPAIGLRTPTPKLPSTPQFPFFPPLRSLIISGVQPQSDPAFFVCCPCSAFSVDFLNLRPRRLFPRPKLALKLHRRTIFRCIVPRAPGAPSKGDTLRNQTRPRRRWSATTAFETCRQPCTLLFYRSLPILKQVLVDSSTT